MASCCSAKPAEALNAKTCPACGEPGRSVQRITLKALLRAEALMQLSAAAYRFCPTAACDVVYFASESLFRREDLTVPVFQKQAAGERTVCYCFDVTESDLRSEIGRAGRSTAPERINALVKGDRCACEVRNPQGSCCLGNVSNLVKALTVDVVPAR